MRVLNTHTCQFEEIDPENPEGKVYAILSHTWAQKPEPEEQTYEQLRNIQRRYGISESGASSSSATLRNSTSWLTRIKERLSKSAQLQSIWDDPELSPKIRDACAVARKNGYRYIWIDSCCIDKSSSSELSEAINSMYKWYDLAAVCYAYLVDVPPGENHQADFHKSRWFKRGWTLQELIAPLSVEFLSKDWTHIGSKHDLVELVESITTIDEEALLHLKPLDTFSVAQRLSWAANRETTRPEDRAYSLFGIFGINMPTLYGEGSRAFRRLQERIMERTPDQSLFAWGDLYLSPQRSQYPHLAKAFNAILESQDLRRDIFASSPDDFKGCKGVRTARHDTGRLGHKIAYTHTPYGISTQLWMVPLTQDLLRRAIPHSAETLQLNTLGSPEGSRWYIVILRCELGERQRHLLGRVCYLTPSGESDVNFVFTGSIRVASQQGTRLVCPDLFLLSPETIKDYRWNTKLETVYIPHPEQHARPLLSLRDQPYTTVKFVLSRATRDVLRSRGYSTADLHHPDLDHPGKHWLTLSRSEHTITVEFQYTLENDGRDFTVKAEVTVITGKASGSRVQPDPALDSNHAGRHAVFWTDSASWGGWSTKLDYERVKLSAAGVRALTVDLGLDFAGSGYYLLRVDVLGNAPPASSGAELTVDHAEGEESTKERSSSGGINIEDADKDDLGDSEAGERETVTSAEARPGDGADTSDNLESRDANGDGV